MADPIDTVIEDGSLRQLAHDRSPARVPVLIEVKAPTEPVDVPLGRGAAVVGRPATISVEASNGDVGPAESAESSVRRILGRHAHYLRAARSFAADATGAQLAALAADPSVAAIRPNRRLTLSS